MPRYRFIAAAIAAILFALPSPGNAQSDTGQVVITVTDAGSKAPIGLARVLLDGPVITPEFTGPDGKVIFDDVPTGIYIARVTKSGYSSLTSSEFEVLEGRSVTVTVALASTQGLKTLAVVAVQSTASISSSDITDSSAVRKLSNSLGDALNKLSGVSVTTDPNGASDASETISLEGEDPSQTALTLDGVPLNAPGTAGDLNQINTDLFSGASVSFSPSAGSLAGSVNFRTLEPTLSWQGRLTTSVGDYGSDATTISEQGSIGRLGIAVVHTIRGSDSPLAGDQYLDASGLDYVHSGAKLTGGDLVKLRTRLGEDQTITASYISSNAYNDLICNQFTGPVPCGYGPGNASYRHFAFETLTDTALVGAVGLQVSAYGTQGYFDRDLLAQLVDLVPDPYSTDTEQSTDGFSLNATLPSRDRHTLSVQASSTDARFAIDSYAPEFPVLPISTSTSYSSMQLTDSVHSSQQLTLGEQIGLSQSQASRASLIGGVSAAWGPTAADRYSASVNLGNSGATPARTAILSDPSTLTFNCEAGIGYGDGPGDVPGAQNSSSYRVTWQHRLSVGQVTTSLYRQVQQGTPLELAVNGSALPPSYFPPGYFAAATQIYDSALGCDVPTGAITPQNLYIDQLVTDATRTYQGAQVTGGLRLGPSVVAEPYYDIQGALLTSDDPRLNNPFSYEIPGSQLPNVPLHLAGLTLDYRANKSPLEALADANYTSFNNRQNLPGYVTADAALSLSNATSSLTLAYTNVFDKFPQLFASPQGAIALTTIDEGPLPTVERPLSPRQYSLTYMVKFGEIPQPGRAPQPSASPRGFFGSLPALPSSPPPHPLDVSSTNPLCSATDSTAAAAMLTNIRAYVAAVEAAKTSAGYPDQPPAGAPAIPGFAVAYHKTATSYALVLTPTKFGGLRSFAVCSMLHSGTLVEANALHLYVADSGAFNRSPLTFAPEAGLYLVRRPPTPNQEQFRVYRLPTAPPATPFALVTNPACTSDQQPAAAAMLASLAAYVAAFDPAKPEPPQPGGWSVTPHLVAGGKYWLELEPANLQTIPAILDCGHVSTGAAADIKAAGLDAAPPPALNFAQAFGLYLVRPTGPPGAPRD
jgi:hypothetical protein